MGAFRFADFNGVVRQLDAQASRRDVHGKSDNLLGMNITLSMRHLVQDLVTECLRRNERDSGVKGVSAILQLNKVKK